MNFVIEFDGKAVSGLDSCDFNKSILDVSFFEVENIRMPEAGEAAGPKSSFFWAQNTTQSQVMLFVLNADTVESKDLE